MLPSGEMTGSESACDGDGGARVIAVAVELASECEERASILLSVAAAGGAVFPA